MSDRSTTESAAARWVEGYVRAWESNDPSDIRALFTDDAVYRETMWDEPWNGVDAIVEGWRACGDQRGTYTFTSRVVGVDGNRVFIQGETRYPARGDFANLWMVDLADDGRAMSFTEWWIRRRAES